MGLMVLKSMISILPYKVFRKMKSEIIALPNKTPFHRVGTTTRVQNTFGCISSSLEILQYWFSENGKI